MQLSFVIFWIQETCTSLQAEKGVNGDEQGFKRSDGIREYMEGLATEKRKVTCIQRKQSPLNGWRTLFCSHFHVLKGPLQIYQQVLWKTIYDEILPFPLNGKTVTLILGG